MSASKRLTINLSVIIPVYNRPAEIDELLASLCTQTNQSFEVIVVDDGSTIACTEQVNKYSAILNLHYFYQQNTGPGLARNYGNERAGGNYSIFLDSDCVLPPHYIQTVLNYLENNYTDAFGGPDMADENFTVLQKAINYAMTSFFTTGGIRGGGEKLDKFYPRSFNMGYSKEVFEKTKGFSKMRFGEDIDMSIRILKAGFKTALLKEAYVYHKRRTSLRQFFKQVYNSGIARINLYKKHPGSLKPVHTLPSVFLTGTVFLLLLTFTVSWLFILPMAIYALLILTDSTIRNKSIRVGLYAIPASFLQLTGYGAGFINAFWKRVLFSRKEFSAFTDSFYE